MKKIILAIALVTAAPTLYAQATPALDKVTKATCDCVAKQKDNIKNETDAQKILSVCMMQSAGDKLPALQKELKLKSLNTPAEAQKLGQAVALKLSSECPAFLDIMMRLQGNIQADNSKITSTEKSNFMGEIVAVETEGYTYIHIKNEAGRITKFLWLEYFKGSDAYKQNPKLLLGKKVEIQWQQIEIYNAKLNDYMDAKEIRELSLN
ncbi:MAG: hypothetical protein ABIX01_12830 [Chitinophagaceae bacterium]